MKLLKQVFLLLGVSFLTLSVSNCGASKADTLAFYENPPFKVGDIYAQEWMAGTPEGGSGTNVYINLSGIEEGVVFNDVFYGKRSTELVSSPNVRVQYIGYFKNKLSRNIIMDADPINEAVNEAPVVSPFDLLPNEAVISYTQNGKLQYYKTVQVTVKEPLAYPSTNPNGID